jgi:prepilin-type N-terminal cleavage/methylation domain-containing protein
MKRAFTLIELLVVIAIIAILAAILFPVFAQAKESAKKTSAISNAKQLATSVIMYTADYDDNFPSAYSWDDGIGWLWNYGIGVPAGWEGVPAWTIGDANQWMNSTQPYRKNLDLVSAPGMPKLVVNGYEPYNSAPVMKPAEINFSMNGLLSTWSATGVNQVSRTPMIWEGHYKQNLMGLSLTNPALQCPAVPVNGSVAPCRFNPSGMPQTGAAGARGDGWFPTPFNAVAVQTYTGGSIYAFTDTSTKFRKIPNGTGMLNQDHMFNTIGATGLPTSANRCQSSATTPGYVTHMRPDNDFVNVGGPVAPYPLCGF